MHDDVVIGGGIAGLTAGFRLQSLGRDVVVLEASPRAGGLVHTRVEDGLILEQGPESLQTLPEVLELVGALGLVDEVLAPDPQAHVRFVLRDGALVRLPGGPGGLFSSPLWSWREALRLLAEPFVPRGRGGPETVHDFVVRRFGAMAARELVDPFVAGVFGGDPHVLEIDSAFEDLRAMEQTAGSVILGGMRRARARAAERPDWAPRLMMTFQRGMATLPEALAGRLGEQLRLNTPAQALERQADAWCVHTPEGPVLARRVWMAAPLGVAARLLGDDDLTVPRAPIAAVHLAWRSEDVPQPPEGFGWLVPSHQRRDALGCIWVSSVFPSHAPDRVMHRVMLGGARAPELLALSEEELVHHARRVAAEVTGIDATPVLSQVKALRDGIPQYPLGHAARVARWQSAWPDLRFLGWATTGVGASHGIRAGMRLGS